MPKRRQTRIRPPEPEPEPATPPEGNQLVNPYFEGPHNGDPWGWQQTYGWDVSIKPSNPSPTLTAARLNDPAQAGEYTFGELDLIWQLVAGRGPLLTLEVSSVQHYCADGGVNVYGAAAADGSWTLLWAPLPFSEIPFGRWAAAPARKVLTLEQGWPHYKVECRGRFLTTLGGIKFTNMLFTSE